MSVPPASKCPIPSSHPYSCTATPAEEERENFRQIARELFFIYPIHFRACIACLHLAPSLGCCVRDARIVGSEGSRVALQYPASPAPRFGVYNLNLSLSIAGEKLGCHVQRLYFSKVREIGSQSVLQCLWASYNDFIQRWLQTNPTRSHTEVAAFIQNDSTVGVELPLGQ